MMKLNLTTLFDATEYLKTEAGQQLKGALDYLTRLVGQVVPALRNGLTFADNFNAKVSTVSLRPDTPQVLKVDKEVVGILPIRVLSTTYGLANFAWYYDTNSRLTVQVGFSGSPAATAQIDVTLVILYN